MFFRLLLFFLVGLPLLAQHGNSTPAFEEALVGAKRFQIPPGLKLDVWAAEPQLSNSVAFSLDGQGRVYLAQSDRWAISVFDITTHTNWLLEDMSFRSVADRSAFLQREFATNLAFLTKDSEILRRIEDRDGDGRADHHENVAEGFNSVADGTAAGVLATGSQVYFANIPNLWRFPAPDSAHLSPVQKPAPEHLVAHGFGVHIGVSGHDLHGLIRGPDGRIYFSFGDRGVCLTNREGIEIRLPDTGGVLRCEPDGRHLEIFCFGLRNPQELAFDDEGNLWTVDNDTAGADPCRVLYLVQGGDYGWRTSYQHTEGFQPWVSEEMWKGGHDGILPLAGTVSQGPSGLAFYPGTGFGDRLSGKFLHCDFPGGIWEFSVKPKGAGFELGTKEKFLWNCWPTDVDFGPDGAAYVLDWVSGWGQTPRGRIYKITPQSSLDPAAENVRKEVQVLLAQGMIRRKTPELLVLLGHADRRVRLEAQWELASRGPASLKGLANVSVRSRNLLQRRHALWGLSQILRSLPKDHSQSEVRSSVRDVLGLLKDRDGRVAAEAARTLAAAGEVLDWKQGSPLFLNPDPVLRRIAAQALVEMQGTPSSQADLTQVRLAAALSLGTGHEQESYLRHFGRQLLVSAALQERQQDSILNSVSENPSPDARWIALLAQRRLAELLVMTPNWSAAQSNRLVQLSSRIVQFLQDSDSRLVEEAGRAIHDVPIVSGLPALAGFITKVDCPPGLHSRVIDACFRLGTQQHAQMLASFAVREDVPDSSRVLAIQALADWGSPGALDRVNGLWRPLLVAKRSNEVSPSPSTQSTGNPMLDRVAQSARNLGRAAEIPVFPSDLGRTVSYEEGRTITRNPASVRRAFLRVAGDLMNPFQLSESGIPVGTRESLPVQIATAVAAAKLQAKEASTPLYEKFSKTNTAPTLRRAILRTLGELRSAQAAEAVKMALSDSDPQLRATALPWLDRIDGEDSVEVLMRLLPAAGKTFSGSDLRLAQAALAVLARSPSVAADAPVLSQLESLRAGTAPPALVLDIISAAELRGRSNTTLAERVAQVRASSTVGDLLSRRGFALDGGDPQRGKEVFFRQVAVQCLRCHQIGTDGGNVGPDLSTVGQRLTRELILESILQPNARIAVGYETAVVISRSGDNWVGIVQQDTAEVLTLRVTEGETGKSSTVSLKKSEISHRERGPSAMPEGLADLLTPFELRDLVEYLASLK